MMSTVDEVTVDWPPERPGDEPAGESGPGFEVGAVVGGRYRVRREIGAGGMGSVVEVERLCDGKALALKYCPATGRALRRFAREVRLMARVRHPHVVPVLDADLAARAPYFVMPLAVGSLEDEVPGLAARPAAALAAFHQACLGVQAIHGSGIVHRDIKPANLLRFRSGRVAVSDLGVAKLAARDTTVLTRTRAVVGTIAYVAPEQLLPAGSRLADVRTDVYQLGKVLYRLLTGLPPVLIEPSALPRGLAHVITRATCAVPDDRYSDLGEFLDALRYYELSLDPARNAREALENLVLQVEDALRRQEKPGDVVREVLALLAPLERLDASAAIERFDRLPDDLLPVLALDHAAEFLPVLRGYARALPARVGGFKFDYADRVARRMRRVFRAARHPGVKAAALEATLLAAVALNRFAAMDAFNRLLMSVTTVDVALPVAEMLRTRRDAYAEVARGASPDLLHPAIRDVQNELLTTVDAAF